MQVVASASAAAGLRGAGGRDLGCRGGRLCWAVVLDEKVEDKAYHCLRVCLALRMVGMGVWAFGSGLKLDESWMCERYTSGEPCLAVSRPVHGDCVVTFCPFFLPAEARRAAVRCHSTLPVCCSSQSCCCLQ